MATRDANRTTFASEARRSAVIAIALICWTAAASAQDLTPRAYWPAPKGTRIAVAGYAQIDGNILFDPTIPLYEVESKVNTALVGYLQTFSLFGRSSNILIKLPYIWGRTEGLVETTPESSKRSVEKTPRRIWSQAF